MSAKEIKELRLSGKLAEALAMAEMELMEAPDNIWGKRNLSWVYYAYAKLHEEQGSFDLYVEQIEKIKGFNFSIDEVFLFDSLTWLNGKMCFHLLKMQDYEISKMVRLWHTVKDLHYTKPSESYSFFYKGFHKAFKDTIYFLEFADWWNFENFIERDFQKEALPNGKEVMALVEQAYISYAKQLLPKQEPDGSITFDKAKTSAFMPKLESIVEKYPKYQYPGYFQAKLLLALGEDKEQLLSILLPFVKRKRNDFWAWDVLSEVFKDDNEIVLACYCKALSLNSPEEMLVNLRQRMAAILIDMKLYNEAKTEIEKLLAARQANKWPVPNIVRLWQDQGWYAAAISGNSNYDFYAQYLETADGLLFSDIPEEKIFVDFVNKDKKMLNFIASDQKFGFLKYERFLKKVNVGDVLLVRFDKNNSESLYKIYTAKKIEDLAFSSRFLKHIEGILVIKEGKTFGFVNDIFVNPAFISKHNLQKGMQLKGTAIKSYNKDKKEWSWKVNSVE